MAKLPLSYNTADNKEGMSDFSAIPAGPYIMQIVKSDYKQTKAKTGHYLQVVLKVLTGKYKGRTLFENLNLDNPNPIAVEIANKTLNSICQACDKAAVEDSQELHGIPMKVTLKVVEKTETQPASNSVVKYEKYDGETIVDEPDTGVGASTEEASGSGDSVKKKMPWEA